MNLLELIHQLVPLAADATEGPWAHQPEYDDALVFFDEDGTGVCPNPYRPICRMDDLADDYAAPNAAFIAAARNLLTPENLKLIIAALTPNAALPAPYAGMCALAALGRPCKDEAEDWRCNRVTGRHDDTFDAGMRHGRAELACELLGLVSVKTAE